MFVSGLHPLATTAEHNRGRNRPEVPEGVLRGIEDIADGNTASKEDLESLQVLLTGFS